MTDAEIKAARHELGLSLSGMATELGMNRRTIQRMESGEYPIIKRTAETVSHLLLKRRLQESIRA